MTYQQYTDLFEDILQDEHPDAPYDNPNYIKYVRLNHSRMNRWMKRMELDEALANALRNYRLKQHWIIITEPWCGDAAHSLPFLVRLAEQSAAITYELQLRDSEPYLINNYLTNGGKSIPKLIARDEDGADLFTWGPRPEPAQQLWKELKTSGADFETINHQLQNWYNNDKGQTLQKEMLKELSRISVPD